MVQPPVKQHRCEELTSCRSCSGNRGFPLTITQYGTSELDDHYHKIAVQLTLKWGYPKIGVPPVIIHFRRISLINHFFWVPSFMETPKWRSLQDHPFLPPGSGRHHDQLLGVGVATRQQQKGQDAEAPKVLGTHPDLLENKGLIVCWYHV